MNVERTRLMGDGQAEDDAPSFAAFLHRHRISLAVLSGPAKGLVVTLAKPITLLGRGPGVDVDLDDPTLSRVHAALEFRRGEFHVRDLQSSNGTELNGKRVEMATLENGDTLQLGRQRLQFVVEEREHVAPTHELPLA